MARGSRRFLACCAAPLVPEDHIDLTREELKALYTKSIALNNGKLIVHGIFARADTCNNNKRIYPKHILKREVARYELEHIADGTALGELDHPNYASRYFKCLNLPNLSHQVLKVKWKGDQLWGSIEVLPTPSGLLLWELYSQGIKLGVSSRGWASLRTDNELKCVFVDDDFELITFDFVTEPSTRGAYLVPIQKAYKHKGRKGLPDQTRCVQISHLGHGVCSMRNIHKLPDPAVLVTRVAELQRGALTAAKGGDGQQQQQAPKVHGIDKLLLYSHYVVHVDAPYLDREVSAREYRTHLATFATRAHLADQEMGRVGPGVRKPLPPPPMVVATPLPPPPVPTAARQAPQRQHGQHQVLGKQGSQGHRTQQPQSQQQQQQQLQVPPQPLRPQHRLPSGAYAVGRQQDAAVDAPAPAPALVGHVLGSTRAAPLHSQMAAGAASSVSPGPSPWVAAAIGASGAMHTSGSSDSLGGRLLVRVPSGDGSSTPGSSSAAAVGGTGPDGTHADGQRAGIAGGGTTAQWALHPNTLNHSPTACQVPNAPFPSDSTEPGPSDTLKPSPLHPPLLGRGSLGVLPPGTPSAHSTAPPSAQRSVSASSSTVAPSEHGSLVADSSNGHTYRHGSPGLSETAVSASHINAATIAAAAAEASSPRVQQRVSAVPALPRSGSLRAVRPGSAGSASTTGSGQHGAGAATGSLQTLGSGRTSLAAAAAVVAGGTASGPSSFDAALLHQPSPSQQSHQQQQQQQTTGMGPSSSLLFLAPAVAVTATLQAGGSQTPSAAAASSPVPAVADSTGLRMLGAPTASKVATTSVGRPGGNVEFAPPASAVVVQPQVQQRTGAAKEVTTASPHAAGASGVGAGSGWRVDPSLAEDMQRSVRATLESFGNKYQSCQRQVEQSLMTQLDAVQQQQQQGSGGSTHDGRAPAATSSVRAR